MNALQSSLYAIAITSCLFGLYKGADASRERPYRFLNFYLLLVSAKFVLEWLMLNPASPAKSLWLGLLMCVSLLVAPCLWMFTREVTEGRPPSIWSLSRTHLWVIATGVALALPLIQRTHGGSAFENSSDLPTYEHALFIRIALAACATLFLAQVPIYLRACAGMLVRETNRRDVLFHAIESRPLNAVRLLWFVVFAGWGVSFLRVIHCMTLGKDTGWGIAFAILEVAATVAAVWAMLAPSSSSEEAPVEQSATAKYGKSSLDEPARARIRRKLEEAFTRARVHLDNRLTLDGLCGHLRENPHYVSQVINQDLGSSFYELLNLRRVESAKQALLAAPERTILEISLDAGFNSKSTFNTAFRQHTGVTPTEYRRKMCASTKAPDASFTGASETRN